jgi:hypothetical protein
MAWLVVIVLAPLVMMLVGVYVVAQLAMLVLRIAFGPVVWLAGRPTRQRITIRHYDG